MPLPCLVCGVVPETALPGDHEQPWGATTFHSPGHYGSTVWDPMDGTLLEINVCDGCLRGRHERVVRLRPGKPADPIREPWMPSQDEDETEA